MKASIIIPAAYASYLELVMQSLLNQTQIPLEVIISEDGQNPTIKSIIDRYAQQAPFSIKHICGEKKGFRPSLARNRGAAEANGEILLFCDGDLLLHPKFVYDFSKAVKHGTALNATRAFIKKEQTQNMLSKKKIPKKIPFSWIEKNHLNAIRMPEVYRILPSTNKPATKRGGFIGVYRDDFFSVNGYNEDFVGWGLEDTDFVCRLHHNGIDIKKLKFAGLTHHLWHKFENRQSVSNNKALLDQTIKNKITYCTNGVKNHL